MASGRAFEGHPEWADEIGADAVAASYSEAMEYLAQVAHLPIGDGRPPVGARSAVLEVEQLQSEGGAVVEAAVASALEIWPGLSERAAAIRATRDDLHSTLRAISSSVLVRDEQLLREYVNWFEDVLSARGLPLTFVPTAFDLLANHLPPELVQAVAVSRQGVELCQEPPMK